MMYDISTMMKGKYGMLRWTLFGAHTSLTVKIKNLMIDFESRNYSPINYKNKLYKMTHNN